jgi:hypothetical protein
MADVLAVQDHIRQIEARNASGHLEFPDFGDEDPYAGRSQNSFLISIMARSSSVKVPASSTKPCLR